MSGPAVIKSPRLLLRQWQEADLPAFARLNADPEVMTHFPAPLSIRESDALAHKLMRAIDEQGWGVWALQRRDNGEFIGFTGLHPCTDMPFADGVEIAWRLARPAWGQGFATEAARQALQHGFIELELDEIVSFTACSNLRSIAVMERLGMRREAKTFMHPRVPVDSPLRKHVLYRICRKDFLQTVQND